MKLTQKLFAAFAAAVGITMVATAATTKTWTTVMSTPTTGLVNISDWGNQYDHEERYLAFKVDFDETDYANATLVTLACSANSGNLTTITTTEEGAVKISAKSGAFTATSTTKIVAGSSHVFTMLFRRGLGTNESVNNQIVGIVLYMDGAELVKYVGSDTSTIFGGKPFDSCTFGADGSANALTAYYSKLGDKVKNASDYGTEDDTMATLVADSEELEGLDYLWGTAGSATHGIATKADGKYGLNSMTLNFSNDGNVINTGVSKETATGYVRVKSVKLMNRADATKIPTSLTLKQGDVEIMATPTAGTGMSVYNTSGAKINLNSLGTDFGYSLFTFTDDVLFDPAQDITFTISGTDSTHNGFSVMQPKTAGFGSGDWTPVVDIMAVNRLVLGTTYTATISENIDFDKITWDPELPAELSKNDRLVIMATDTPTITFTAAYTTEAQLTINGAAKIAAADSFYDDDIIVHKTLATFGKITADNVTSADPKSGFSGGVVKSTTQFILHEQAYEIISLNIGGGGNSAGSSPSDYLVSGTSYVGLAPVQGNTWINLNQKWGSRTTANFPSIVATADGSTTIAKSDTSATSAANNTYNWGSATDAFLKGYLDDGSPYAQVTVTGVPYSKYDVIVYAATDTGSVSFRAVTVNGTTYTYDSENPETAKVGSANWGASQNKTAVYGTNAICIRNQTASTLTIVGGSNGDGARGGIAAVQILETSRVVPIHFTTTISGNEALSTATWTPAKTREFLDIDTITITNTAENAIFTLDQDVTVAKFSVVCAAGTGLTLAKGDVTLAIPTFDLTEAAGAATLDFNPGTATVKAGTDTTLNQIGTGSVTIDADKKLTVAASGLTRAQLTNNGTLNFKGGTEADPIVYTFTGSGDSGTCTLAADTYVEMIVDGNKKYAVTGAGANTSFVKITHATDGTGMANYAIFRDVTLVSGVNTSGKYLWVEKGGTVDSSVDLVSTGTGIWLANDYTVNTIAGSGTFANKALTLAPTHDADYSGATGIGLTVGGTGAGVQTLSGAYTGALTVNAGATVKLAGNANPSSIVNNGGTVEYLSGATCNLGKSRTIPSGYVLNEGVNVKATQTAKEYGKGTASVFTGFLSGTKITLSKLDGTSEVLTVDAEGRAISATGTPRIDGAATLFDVTFTNLNDVGTLYYGTFSYKADPNARLQFDSPATFANTNKEDQIKDRGVYIKHHPYIDNAASTINSLGDFTAVFVGEMSATTNRIFVHFGSSSGSNQGILITTLAEKNAVGVFSNQGYALTELTTLSVPNAATARHVYIVTKKEVEGDTVFTIYLDGVKRAEKTISGDFALGTANHCGVQVGADFGNPIRNNTPYKAVENVDTETGVLNVCRIYDYTLSQAQVTMLTTEYPYVSEGGLYTRTVEGAADYSAAGTWAKSPSSEPEYAEPTGTDLFLPSATLTAGGAATVTVNATAEIDTITFNGAAMGFVKDDDGTNKVVVDTAVVNAPITVQYGALDFSKAAVSLGDDGALAFDLADFPLDLYFANAKIQMTGLTDESDAISVKNVPSAEGRTASLDFEDGVYYLNISVEDHPFVYDGTWTWNGEAVTAETVSNNVAQAIVVKSDLLWPVDRASIIVSNGTLKVAAAPASPCAITVESGAMLDLNGCQCESTVATLDVTLNGGEIISTAEQDPCFKGLTLTKNSTITVAESRFIAIQSSMHTWARITVRMNGHTLTKAGEGTLYLVNTDFEGDGMIYVTDGELRSNETSNLGDTVLKIADGATVYQRNDNRTLNVNKIIGEGGILDIQGIVSGFTLEGTISIVDAGAFGTITNAANAVANVGTKRGLTFAGAGTVNVTLTDDEIAGGDPITVFTKVEGATTVIGTVVTTSGSSICCTTDNGVITLTPDNDCVTFTSVGGFTLKTLNIKKNWIGKMQYSSDKVVWTEWNGEEISAAQIGGAGDFHIYMRGDANTGIARGATQRWVLTPAGENKIACTGNIETLRGATGDAPAETVMANYCYYGMFYEQTALSDAPALPATTLADSCYASMFHGCTSLTSAPEQLPAMGLKLKCYEDMFGGCTLLTAVPELPATTLADNCYASMFIGCTSLTTAPALLPAATAERYCCSSMFNGCSSLTNAPALPANDLDIYCYYHMFEGCASLKTAPALPATELASVCYGYMFKGCTSLTNAPALPATKVPASGYLEMFRDCTSLMSLPELPATNLAQSAYCSMFQGCTSLTAIPKLPAGTLGRYCYQSMFADCTGIKMSETCPGKAWAIPEGATTATSWNSGMFSGTGGDFTGAPEIGVTYYVQSVTAKIAPQEDDTTSGFEVYTNGMVEVAAPYEVIWGDTATVVYTAAEGYRFAGGVMTFATNVVANAALVEVALADDQKPLPIDNDCVTFTSAGGFTLKTYNLAKNWDVGMQWSSNKVDWIEWNGEEISAWQTDGAGDFNLYVRGDENTVVTGYPGKYSKHYQYWVLTPASVNKIACTGNIETLRGATGDAPADTPMANYCYNDMFKGCNSLTSAPELPAMTLADYCYWGMFGGCTSLTAAPALPAMTMACLCYDAMFSGCTSLTAAPELPATTVAGYCYSYMFSGCTSLTDAPDLPAKTLSERCYADMFNGCTAMTNAPVIAATTLAPYCCYEMFLDCKALTVPPELSAMTLAECCYWSMFERCKALATAPALPATTLNERCYQAMFANCHSLAAAPELPATTLAEYCYGSMFFYCTALTALPELPATTLAGDCYHNMFEGCAGIKISKTGPGKEWSIPADATEASNWNYYMFRDTGGSFTGMPTIGTVYYVGAEQTDIGGGMTAKTFGGDCEVTGTGALTDTTALKEMGVTNLVIGSGITSVGANAFKKWQGLRSVEIGTDCTTIASDAFFNCRNLTNVVCHATTVGDYAFYRCNSLEKMTFDAKPTFGEQAFTFQSAIYMKDGFPQVYTIPTIEYAGCVQKLMGANDPAAPEGDWVDLTDATQEERSQYHFFKVVIQ